MRHRVIILLLFASTGCAGGPAFQTPPEELAQRDWWPAESREHAAFAEAERARPVNRMKAAFTGVPEHMMNNRVTEQIYCGVVVTALCVILPVYCTWGLCDTYTPLGYVLPKPPPFELL
jgi:hypothetical protein